MLTSCIENNQRIAHTITPFSSYSAEMESLFNNLQNIPINNLLSIINNSILNGGANTALHNFVPIEVRKEAGIFFTSTELAEKVASNLAPILRSGVRLIDPACGAGNLLLACTRHLPLGKSFSDTLKLWSNIIIGYDLYPEFVRAARLRLLLLTASLFPKGDYAIKHPKEVFNNLKTCNLFSNLPVPSDTCVVINPPFGYTLAPDDCQWASGKIQIAGLFVERLLREAHAGQHLVAILPDVLRSGTRYQKWRDLISSFCTSLTIEPAGRFDANTDVDVFLLQAVTSFGKSESMNWPISNPPNRNKSKKVVSDFFEVYVGTVVPHRDPIEGQSYPYIHARTAFAWKTLDHISEERQSISTVFSPPFVVVHRTSSPSDKHRCVATIINEKRRVAVENHLLVLLPKDESLETCRSLLDILKSPQTNEWVNQRIRCRHLTVTALRDLPYSLNTIDLIGG